MPATVIWDDEARTILRVDLHNHTWAEYNDAVQQVVEQVSQQSHRIDIIINNPGSPAPGNPLPHLRASIHQIGMIPNIGLVAAINSRRMPGFIRALVDMVLRGYGGASQQRVRFVNTLDEARRRIHEDREKPAKA